jgi:hypothetical protein
VLVAVILSLMPNEVRSARGAKLSDDKTHDQIRPLSELYPQLGPQATSWLYNQKNLDLTDLTDEQIEALVPLDRVKFWTPWRLVGLVLVSLAISCLILHIRGGASILTIISLICLQLPKILLERSCSRRFHEATDKRLPG